MSADLLIGYGSKIVMYFSITLEDGTVADTTRDDQKPFEFTLGDGQLVEGLELSLIGLKAGDKQSLLIEPKDAFGYPDDSSIHWMPRGEFDSKMKLQTGMVIGFSTPSDQEMAGRILVIEDDKVKVDFNHPMAGHEITFEVEVLSVEPAKTT